MNAKIAEAIRNHPEVIEAAKNLEHAIMRAAEGAAVQVLRGALPFPFSLAAPLAGPVLVHVEGLAEHALDGALDHLFSAAGGQVPVPVIGQVAPEPEPEPAPMAKVGTAPAEALQAAGSQSWRLAAKAAVPPPGNTGFQGDAAAVDVSSIP